MAKKQTKADLEERIAQLEELITKADAWPKKPTLMDRIGALEKKTMEEVQRLTVECQLEVGTLINGCMEQTGRNIGVSTKMVAGVVPKMGDGSGMFDFIPMSESNGAKATLQEIGYCCNPKNKRGYAFKNVSEFMNWASDQLRDGWNRR